MIIGRRTFIREGTCVASTAVIATFVSRSPAEQPQPERSAQSLGPSAGDPVVLKIYGWTLDSESPGENEVFIRINQSWRTAWR